MRQELKDWFSLAGTMLAAAAALLFVLLRPIKSPRTDGDRNASTAAGGEHGKVARRNALNTMAFGLAALSAVCQFIAFML
jgi:hypothetical protein